MNHTPGPWTPSFNGAGTWQIIGNAATHYSKHIGLVESSQQDAHLIAAAPALLAACRTALEMLHGTAHGISIRQFADQLRAAIDQATR